MSITPMVAILFAFSVAKGLSISMDLNISTNCLQIGITKANITVELINIMV
jgi:hypothetical protein